MDDYEIGEELVLPFAFQHGIAIQNALALEIHIIRSGKMDDEEGVVDG